MCHITPYLFKSHVKEKLRNVSIMRLRLMLTYPLRFGKTQTVHANALAKPKRCMPTNAWTNILKGRPRLLRDSSDIKHVRRVLRETALYLTKTRADKIPNYTRPIIQPPTSCPMYKYFCKGFSSTQSLISSFTSTILNPKLTWTFEC